MGDQFVSVREFDRYREGVQRDIARLEQDIDDLRDQRETDQTTARTSSQHDREWTWTRKIGLFMAGIALAGLELQYLASHK